MSFSTRPGTAAESLADLGWFLALTLGFVAAWRLSGSRADCSIWVVALLVSNSAIYFGRFLRRRSVVPAPSRPE